MGFYLVSDGSAIPWRVRARSSCFCNLSVTDELCRGCLIADVPAIVGHVRTRGYDGWYTLEQDTILTGEPQGEGPVADVWTSAEHLRAVLGGSR